MADFLILLDISNYIIFQWKIVPIEPCGIYGVIDVLNPRKSANNNR